MQSIDKRISSIFLSWFYSEPLFFSVAQTHCIIPNENISCVMRTGNRKVEYNPALIKTLDDSTLEKYLSIEITRILLGHPYHRQPHHAKPLILALASDAVIWQLEEKCRKKNPECEIELAGVRYLKAKVGSHATFPEMNFEAWYKYIYDIVYSQKGGENAGGVSVDGMQSLNEMAELWSEDDEALSEIESEIKAADDGVSDDGEGGELVRALKESADFSFDYRKALTQFRQNIVSANRKLTRMRPSRRYGFKAMGSRYERKANVLIAVDVSGSITDESFEHFAHAIKNFFFLGLIEKIDLIFFDVNLKNTTPIPFSKKVDLDQIKGRGGTNFQVPFDYFEEHKAEYSGMILFSDGEGNCPVIKSGVKNILWILDSRLSYEKNAQWITKQAGCRATYLPF